MNQGFDGPWAPLALHAFVLAAITLATTFIAPRRVAVISPGPRTRWTTSAAGR